MQRPQQPGSTSGSSPIEVFLSYAHEDEALLKQLEKHLSLLKRQGMISTWYDRQIVAGTDWAQALDGHLEQAAVILLLVSADFLASDYCYGIEMKRALERHEAKQARVIPIVLRPVDWQSAPFAFLQALPTNGSAITMWTNQDEAFADVVAGLRHVLAAPSGHERGATDRPSSIPDRGEANAPWSRLTEEVGKYQVEGQHAVQGQVVGDHPTVYQYFGPVSYNMPSAPSPSAQQPTIEDTSLTSELYKNPAFLPPLSQSGMTSSSQPSMANPIIQRSGWSRIRFSRRSILLGLSGLIVAGSGIIAWQVSYWRSLVTTALGPAKATSSVFPTLGSIINTYGGHSLGVNALVWSPDGTRIASASVDKTVQVWDATSGGRSLIYRGHSSSVYTVAWSGARIASGNNDVQVWDATSGGHPFIYQGYAREIAVYSVAWSRDGTHIASGAYDSAVQVWSAVDGTRSVNYTGHKGYVLAVAWSPDGTYIASGGHDKTVQVWNAATGHHIVTYYGHSSGVSSLAWSPDGIRIASGAYDKTVHVWDTTTGKNAIIYQGHTDNVYAVAWSGKYLASAGTDKTVQIWDATSGSHIFTYQGHGDDVYAVAWSPDGTKIASGGQSRLVQVWQAKQY